MGFASRGNLLVKDQAVLQPGGASVGDTDPSNMKGKATQEAFMPWLNFANGGVGWNQIVGNGQTFHDAMAQVENILLTPNRTHNDYVLAKNIAASINGSSASNLLRDFCRKETDLNLAMDGGQFSRVSKSDPGLASCLTVSVRSRSWRLGLGTV